MNYRKATEKDLTAIVKMMADDVLGKKKEKFQSPLPIEYVKAFQNINEDKNQELIVLENEKLEVIGTLQISYIQYISYLGGMRAQIENVFIRADQRGLGIGKKVFKWAINRAKEKNAHLVQLTSNKERPRSIKFYENLGFKATHEGMKLHF
ncbi:GNAT family N-acetyltransferase [Polaribacter sp. Asnod1-A03]|uniref:GNAT family N-acetyltransferase n=1 Tax=Polaribacter sp. Asnod1-A03 TaxID=3160581 RepID=UPI00386AF719